VLWFAEQTFAVRWLATALTFLTGLVCMSLWLRRFGLLAGCEVGRFTLFAAESPIDNAAIEQLLRDRLEHVGFRLQRPAGVGGAIGPALAVDSLLPSGNPASPLKDALAGLDELATKGGVPFAIGQVERVLGLLRRRRRYRIAGAVQVSGAEARAWVDLTDLRTRSVLAHVSASSIEIDRRYGSSRRTSSATPLDLMSGVLEVSAYKIWHALAEATRPGLKPSSWATLAQFVSGLDALAEAETQSASTPGAERACRIFDSIVNDFEPTYSPACFYRGFARLLMGELDTAEREMTEIGNQVERMAKAYALALAQQWISRKHKPRWRLVRPLVRLHTRLSEAGRLGRFSARPLDNIAAAHRYWSSILNKAVGGNVYLAAKAWENLKKEADGLEDWPSGKLNIAQHRLALTLNTFELTPFLLVIVERALGLKDIDEKDILIARMYLDEALDLSSIAMFNAKARPRIRS
jgi:hypothetical protein